MPVIVYFCPKLAFLIYLTAQTLISLYGLQFMKLIFFFFLVYKGHLIICNCSIFLANNSGGFLSSLPAGLLKPWLECGH